MIYQVFVLSTMIENVRNVSVMNQKLLNKIIERAQSLAVAAANNYRDRQGTQHINADQRNNTERENTDEDNHNPNSNESIEGNSSLQSRTVDKQATNANSAPVKPSDASKSVPINA